MIFPAPLIPGELLRRYQRFLADVRLADGSVVTAHCSNSGSMLQMCAPGSAVMLSPASNLSRRTRWDWQMIRVNGDWAGVNTAVPNLLLREGFETGVVKEFQGYETIRMEVPYGQGSRVDAVLSGPSGQFYVEAKNVTLVEEGCARFPDAVTARGTKHLADLADVVRSGGRAAMFFLVQRHDADRVGTAGRIDPVYASRLREVRREGVEIIAWRARVSPEGVFLECPLPFTEE